MKRIWNIKKKSGVSPVIATILMVAITVVLAAVLYVMVMNMSSNQGNTTPTGSIAQSNISGTKANMTFGQFSTSVGVSQFKFVIENTTSQRVCTIQMNSDNSGSAYTLVSGSVAASGLNIGGLYYFDVAANGKINVGDTLTITFAGTGTNQNMKVSMIYIPTGNVVTYTTFTY